MSGYKHLLLATDFSEHSEQAAERAAELAQHYDAKISVIHVIEYFPEDMPAEWVAAETVDPKQYLLDRAREQLSELVQRAGLTHAPQHVMVARRSAKHEILQVAKDHEVDLIVVGSHGRHGLELLLGSTANAILHGAPCDVLAVRLPR